MELDDRDLRLIDPDSNAVLHTQPIHQIRVWGVGRDNGRLDNSKFIWNKRSRETVNNLEKSLSCRRPKSYLYGMVKNKKNM